MNTMKTALLLTGLTLLLLFGGAAVAGQNGMTVALVLAAIMNGVAYFFSDKIALRMSGARPVTREQAPRLYAITERLCQRASLPMPRLYIIPQAAPNAFATGRNPRNAAVAVTAGLMQLMDDEEVEGVIAHELAHVRNYDILTASVAATLAGAITWLAHMGRWAMIFGGGRDDRNGGGLAALLMLILAPIAALLIQLAISRQREFAADATAARIVGHPFGLIRALEKLGSYNKRVPMDVAPEMASLFIVAPLGSASGLLHWFSTHPPLEKRIAALKNLVIAR
ncbi:MAG: zinc metalloprotease HtpX [Bryobacteraceae bacterium]|nr:zinc metalloprotease HtpX [Bryobacteraceae bacterium]